jgi:hypothetical protein
MKYRKMYNNKPRDIKVKPKIKFEYVDKEGNIIDMESIMRKKKEKQKRNLSQISILSEISKKQSSLNIMMNYKSLVQTPHSNLKIHNPNERLTPRLTDQNSIYHLTQVIYNVDI